MYCRRGGKYGDRKCPSTFTTIVGETRLMTNKRIIFADENGKCGNAAFRVTIKQMHHERDSHNWGDRPDRF